MQDEEKTNLTVPPIGVRIETGQTENTEFSFTEAFCIGRAESCEVRVSDPTVSRRHARISFQGGRWWVNDLQSGNGTFVDGEKVDSAPLGINTRIKLGTLGPELSLAIYNVSQPEETQAGQHSVTHYMEHYFGDSNGDDVGQHTMMIRRAFEFIQKKQKKRYVGIITIVIFLFLAAGSYAVYKHIEARKQKALAEDIFYAIKSLELDFAGLLKTARLSKDARFLEQVENYKARRKKMEENYDKFMGSLNIYKKGMSEEERIILRVARIFGECEVNMPPGFSKEVLNYVAKWRTTKRLQRAVEIAKRNGFISKIVETMSAHDLPPQFLYLALQESNFNLNACGPKTRFGIAKGMWQFIPSTAVNYGLQTGPLARMRQHDPQDERHDFERSTLAAARYLRDIYDTEAQASGLLVIASYNWGERRVNEMIRTMPKSPRERNFWNLLTKYRGKIPKETYNYVFYIISAAVIGENPRLFGFDFDSILGEIDEKSG